MYLFCHYLFPTTRRSNTLPLGYLMLLTPMAQPMAFKLQQLIDRFSLTHKILDYVKGKGFNLQTCAIALNSIVSCSNLTMWEPFAIRCALFKAC
jgi:hypothetical protein